MPVLVIRIFKIIQIQKQQCEFFIFRPAFLQCLFYGLAAVSYTHLKEKRLCLELLVLAKEECDLYGEVFALAYMGDYYIAVSDMDRAGKYLSLIHI